MHETSPDPTDFSADSSKKAMEAWAREDGVRFLRSLGIRSGDRVLDFGCGQGGYVFPLAQVVEPRGKVIAVDKNTGYLDTLRSRVAESPDQDLIDIQKTDGSLTLDWLAEGSLDAVLLFDVLQHVPDWDTLFVALRRALKADGLLLINPSSLSHPGVVDVERAKGRLSAYGFILERTTRARVMHYDFLHDEEILVFRAPKGGDCG
jgi:ubiquinone/menaquinone biosynthesis C-methylase UbiE